MLPTTIDGQYNSALYTTDTSQASATIKGGGTDETKKTSSINTDSLGKDDFLKLLLAELQHQDPLNPASNTEFVAQLAQFSSLEQMTQMNTNLQKTLDNNNSMASTINNAMTISYFGKTVATESPDFTYDGSGVQPLRFMLDAASLSGKVEISNEAGDVIRSIDLGARNAGLQTMEWDGMTSRGLEAGPGLYTMKVTAKDAAGGEIGWKGLYTGVVNGISFKDGKSYISVGGVFVTTDKLLSIDANS